jgi:hypothetical protein
MKIVHPLSWVVLSFISAIASSVPVDHWTDLPPPLISFSVEIGGEKEVNVFPKSRKTGIDNDEKPLQEDAGAGGNKYEYKNENEGSVKDTAFLVAKAESIHIVSLPPSLLHFQNASYHYLLTLTLSSLHSLLPTKAIPRGNILLLLWRRGLVISPGQEPLKCRVCLYRRPLRNQTMVHSRKLISTQSQIAFYKGARLSSLRRALLRGLSVVSPPRS